MQVFLLYPDREWKGEHPYFDTKSIIDDLGLATLFHLSSGEQRVRGGIVQAGHEADRFLEKTMEKVMMEPLHAEREIVYRQEIIKDCLDNEEFIREIYEFAWETIDQWNRLGRKTAKANRRDPAVNLVTDVHILQLFTNGLVTLKEILAKYEKKFSSEGLRNFTKRLREDFSDTMEENLKQLLDSIAFYADKEEDPNEQPEGGKRFLKKERIVLQCDISKGLKLSGLKLEKVETFKKRCRGNLLDKVLDSFAPEPADDLVLTETKQLEYQIVRYIVSCCDSFVVECRKFFEELAFQTGFYMGAFHISQRFLQSEIALCFPTVGAQDGLSFVELKDIVMAVEQDMNPVSNRSEMKEKMLLIVTGANQGGKSTFLRSIGIAQVMMQCGLFVGAKSFESGIYPAFFTHFTRREDSEMNSGRLDEELGRMSRIIDNLEDRSLVLLNESFATTTEKEGSVIAYDIIKALTESGVKVLMVTHLLSFAKRMYEEGKNTVEFLSAERRADGRRTFKMIQQEPQLTSFGLDLYERIITQGESD